MTYRFVQILMPNFQILLSGVAKVYDSGDGVKVSAVVVRYHSGSD
jgi:hypothetical protein